MLILRNRHAMDFLEFSGPIPSLSTSNVAITMMKKVENCQLAFQRLQRILPPSKNVLSNGKLILLKRLQVNPPRKSKIKNYLLSTYKMPIFIYEDRENIATLTDYIQRNSRSLCDNIGSIYWKNVKKDIDVFYIDGVRPINPLSMGSELINGVLVGKYEPNHWHIILVCAKSGTKGVGISLINRFIEEAKARGVSRITLDALPQVIRYYRNKFNFKLSKTCNENPQVKKMLDQMSSYPNVYTLEQAHEDPYMVELLNKVIDLGLSQGPICKEQKRLSLGIDLDYLYFCSIDGYRMTLCLDQPKEPAVAPKPERRQQPSRASKRIKVA